MNIPAFTITLPDTRILHVASSEYLPATSGDTVSPPDEAELTIVSAVLLPSRLPLDAADIEALHDDDDAYSALLKHIEVALGKAECDPHGVGSFHLCSPR